MQAIDFERIHQRFDGLMFDLCAECGGGCEQDTLAILFPGEAEYIAGKLGTTANAFIAEHCLTVQYMGHDVQILKGIVCTFLNAEFRCGLEKFKCKPLQCLVYPAMIGEPGDKNRIFIDHIDCPMAHRVNDEFRQKAFSILEFIKPALPDWWLEFNLEHGWPLYDYAKFAALGDRNEISVEELMQCRKL